MNFHGAEKYILNRLEIELPEDLFYHGLHHTRDVYSAVLEIANFEGINDEDIMLLKTATLFHDSGFVMHYKNHEEAGCDIARSELPKYDFTPEQIEVICSMIMATKIPQSPKTHLEEIICDADLDYLGREDFKKIGQTLYDELKSYKRIYDEKEWMQIQLNFLKNHKYFTNFSRSHREETKLKHLDAIIKIVESYQI